MLGTLRYRTHSGPYDFSLVIFIQDLDFGLENAKGLLLTFHILNHLWYIICKVKFEMLIIVVQSLNWAQENISNSCY
jgi:hypothetical protein